MSLSYIFTFSGNTQELVRSDVATEFVEYFKNLVAKDGIHENVGKDGPPIDLITTRQGSSLIGSFRVGPTIVAEFAVVRQDQGAEDVWGDLISRGVIAPEAEGKIATAMPSAPWVGLSYMKSMRQHPQIISMACMAATKACALAWLEMDVLHS